MRCSLRLSIGREVIAVRRTAPELRRMLAPDRRALARMTGQSLVSALNLVAQ